MNAQIENMVAEYAKANKINKAKLLAFVEQIAEIASQNNKKSSGKRGKHASEETLALREALRDAIKSTTEAFTVKDMQAKVSVVSNASYTNVSNALRFLAEKEKLVKVVGKVDKAPGVRGKKSLLWSVA